MQQEDAKQQAHQQQAHQQEQKDQEKEQNLLQRKVSSTSNSSKKVSDEIRKANAKKQSDQNLDKAHIEGMSEDDSEDGQDGANVFVLKDLGLERDPQEENRPLIEQNQLKQSEGEAGLKEVGHREAGQKESGKNSLKSESELGQMPQD